jgi:hypothetical protein
MTTQTFVLAIHLLGCAFGIGASTILDLRVLQLLSGRRVSTEDVVFAQLLGWFVRGGLALLWLSGLCFLVRYWYFAPELLGNPKLHAKIAVVLTLTLNGLVIEFVALPLLVRQHGRALFDGLPRSMQAGVLIAGTVSATSWYGAFVLGITRELNFAVSSGVILAAYLILLVLACCVALLVRQVFYKPDRFAAMQTAVN